MEDSVPKSVDIQIYMVSPSAKSAVSELPAIQFSQFSTMSNRVGGVCLHRNVSCSVTAKSASIWSTATQKFLIEIFPEGLTTIPLPYIYM